MKSFFKKSFFLTLTIFLLFLGGCGSQTSSEDMDPALAYINELKDGIFYIRHSDNQCEIPYLGEATFSKYSITDVPSKDRIAWFKEDFDKIPTMTSGDSLILYTKDVLSESFVFERFKDVGSTIGMRGLETTPTGRLCISTDLSRNLTYPYGDTDNINDLPNNYLIIDTLGGLSLRAKKVKDGYSTDGILSEYGTILGLEENESYIAEIYNGTVKHDFTFKADTRVLGSMEVESIDKYYFESNKLLVVEIPEWFKSGYYMINGQGIFRYINETDTENAEYNTPNKNPDTAEAQDNNSDSNLGIENIIGDNDIHEESYSPNVSEIGHITFTYDTYYFDSENNEYFKKSYDKISQGSVFPISIDKAGYAQLTIWLTGEGDMENLKATLCTPEKKYLRFMSAENSLTLTFKVENPGVYSIDIANLGNYIPHIEYCELITSE